MKNKNPVGITPQWFWMESRMWDLISCLDRHSNEGIIACEGEPIEPWLIELREIIDKVLLHYEKKRKLEQALETKKEGCVKYDGAR